MIRSRIRLICVAMLSLAVSGAFRAQAHVARVEYFSFQSVTLSDEDFLSGRKDGTPVMLAGVLRLPKVGDEKLPAVVLVHGSGGVGGEGAPIDEWARDLNNIGVATFAFDAFTGRSIVQTSTNQSQLGRLNMIVDAYRALELLAKHRQIDPRRIAVMGFSRGGQAALYASLKRFQQMHATGEAQFAAFIPVYPSCILSYRKDEEIDKPIRIFHGSADDYNPVAACRPFIERLQKAGQDVQLIEYSGAHHVFDGPATPTPRAFPASESVRACRQAENEQGQIINLDTHQVFSYKDSCVQRGVTMGFNEVAAKQMHADVRGYLTKLFALK